MMFEFGSLSGIIAEAAINISKTEREWIEWTLIQDSKLGELLYGKSTIQEPNEEYTSP